MTQYCHCIFSHQNWQFIFCGLEVKLSVSTGWKSVTSKNHLLARNAEKILNLTKSRNETRTSPPQIWLAQIKQKRFYKYLCELLSYFNVHFFQDWFEFVFLTFVCCEDLSPCSDYWGKWWLFIIGFWLFFLFFSR